MLHFLCLFPSEVLILWALNSTMNVTLGTSKYSCVARMMEILIPIISWIMVIDMINLHYSNISFYDLYLRKIMILLALFYLYSYTEKGKKYKVQIEL